MAQIQTSPTEETPAQTWPAASWSGPATLDSLAELTLDALEHAWCSLAANALDEGSPAHASAPDEPPLRASKRARISAHVAVIEPGHPGHAAYQILDVSREGLFVADEHQSLGYESMIKVGLPSTAGEITTWATAEVLWRGEKDGRSGVGVTLDVAAADQGDWLEAVRAWTDFERRAAAAVVRRDARRTAKRTHRSTG